MVKYFTLITPNTNQDPAQFRHWFLRDHAPQVLKHCPALRRYTINLAEPAPPIDGTIGYSATRYQVVTEMSFDSPEISPTATGCMIQPRRRTSLNRRWTPG